ncbi:YhgE/Pip domain-containing protein [Adlercreutzia caecimuris]|uniref:YhgE/Pip domain-containing protein n=1 Tax=Adlercreutzia caecimuris TaxID=671266 RepID=UPI00272D1C3D|nr:YhgE/Pip domain-containing protein [Adlercreutzia caecimuris]
MRNVLKILRRDLLRLLKTPPALVVIVALMVLPSVYTWYNVIGFWNPYDNTGNLTVCVVNQDAGGSSELTGQLNVGDRIVDQLHENTQLKWEFTDYDSAMEQVHTGTAYAAFVIPENFTADLLTLTTGDFTQPKLQYYVNEKAGPVSPKITDTGASTLDETINSTFVSTVSDVAVKAIDEALGDSKEALTDTRSAAAEKIAGALSTLGEVRSSLGKLDEGTDAAAAKSREARESLAKARSGVDAAQKGLTEVADQSEAMQSSLNQFSALTMPLMNTSLQAVNDSSAKAAQAAAGLIRTTGQAQGAIQAALSQGQAAVNEGAATTSSLRALAAQLPEDSEVRKGIEDAAATAEERTQAARATLDALSGANDRTVATVNQVGDAATTLDEAVQAATGSASEWSTTLYGTTIPTLNEALGTLASTAAALEGTLDTQKLLVDQTSLIIDQLDATLSTAKETVAQTDDLFAGLEEELGRVHDDVLVFGQSGVLGKLLNSSLDADKIAAFMASPTEVVTEQLYPLNAYGSAMAPLFMNLTFWIGAFMLVVILRQEVDDEGIPNLTLGQRYWGRFLFLAVLAVAQALICCAGVLAIGVQTASAPALFIAAACASLAYLSIIFSLSVVLQHIGKGICIVLVFAQIPGATGLYPIEMTSGFFQAIYPLFPFTYGIGAMREAICGFYGTQYETALAVLALFFVIGMAFGLLVRPLMANVNRMVARQVREGGLFNGENVEVPMRPYRLSQIMRVLSDKSSYETDLARRYARFSRWYPRIMRGAIVLGVVVPVALAVVFALTPAEKVWVLTGALLWLILVFVALVVVESLRYSFERQLKLGDMSDAHLMKLAEATRTVQAAVAGESEGAGDEADRAAARYYDHG